MWGVEKPILDAHILSLQKRIQELEQEIDGIMVEHIQALSNINLKSKWHLIQTDAEYIAYIQF